MATSRAVPAGRNQLRLRHLMFAALAVMFLFVLWHDERFVIMHDDKWAYYFPVRWLVLPHALAGLIALLIGPFQLSTRFRQRHLRVHRMMGRVYLSSVVVAATVGMYVSAIHQQHLEDKLWIFALATTWLITGAMAFAAVRNGNLDAHRQWIIRNYAFTAVFVTVRVLNAIPMPDSVGLAPGWILLLATLLITEAGLSWHSVFDRRKTQQFSSARAASP